ARVGRKGGAALLHFNDLDHRSVWQRVYAVGSGATGERDRLFLGQKDRRDGVDREQVQSDRDAGTARVGVCLAGDGADVPVLELLEAKGSMAHDLATSDIGLALFDREHALAGIEA